MQPHERIIVALDTRDIQQALDVVTELHGHVGLFKIGLELQQAMLDVLADPEEAQTVVWAQRIAALHERIAGRMMLDGKFFDIPNTMSGAALALLRRKPKFFTVHASATQKGMRSAVENAGNSKVLAVTVLTSMSELDCRTIYGISPDAAVRQFARMARAADVHGIVCSPQELATLEELGEAAPRIKVTPGIRPAWAAANDQKRITTPADAIRMGTDYIVVGRPITQPPDGMVPAEAAHRIAEEIGEALPANAS